VSEAVDHRIGVAAAVDLLDRDNLAGGPSSIIGRAVISTVAHGRLLTRSEAPP
jgi:hypothetical protein